MAVAPLSSKPVSNPPSGRGDGQSRESLNLRTPMVMRSAVVVALALVIGLSYLFNPPPNDEPKAGVVMELPVFVGDYFGKKGEITKIELDLLPSDTEFARRVYDDSQGHEITCSIVLSGAEQRSIHRPEACLVGQGWTIIGQDDVPIQLPSGHKLVARNLSLEREVVTDAGRHINLRAFYLYWFVGDNITTPSHFTRILLSNWDRVVHNRAHRWAYVSMFALVTDALRPDGLNPDQTKAMMADFTRQIVPTFQISEMPQAANN